MAGAPLLGRGADRQVSLAYLVRDLAVAALLTGRQVRGLEPLTGVWPAWGLLASARVQARRAVPLALAVFPLAYPVSERAWVQVPVRGVSAAQGPQAV